MQSIISQLDDQAVWEEFLAHRLMKGRFTWPMFSDADDYVADEGYLPVARAFIRGEGPGIPERKLINKMGTSKKRTVYCYSPEETRVLKLIAYLLYRYDDRFAPNCYAFRRGVKASDAIFRIRKALRGRKMWAYKLDIHDYFNSISIPILLPKLRELFSDDPQLYAFFERMLTDGRALADGEVVRENRGVMAGTPTSPFLADVYLMDVDRHFADVGVVYARYSDDIILFAPDRETLEEHKAVLLGYLEEYRLEVNPEKEHLYSPDEPFEFLGFRCHGNAIDISGAVRTKMKGKIRRAARSLQRWRAAKGVDAEQAMKALIRKFNAKFFEGDDPDSLSWSRWFFPVINRTEGLKEIDLYLQQYIRYLSTGRHTRTNYRVRYKDLKALGYRSLVHEFYLYKRK
ncbi:MAG: group II intron reverse transcriptase domain-containing protein [Bacteroidales bacterium]|nr:group II intron reverse transcriptase domain-containing protein [Bacteroidales bacterium]